MKPLGRFGLFVTANVRVRREEVGALSLEGLARWDAVWASWLHGMHGAKIRKAK